MHLDGSNAEFTARVIRELDRCGSIDGIHPLVPFLLLFKRDYGSDVQTKIDMLISEIKAEMTNLSDKPHEEKDVSKEAIKLFIS